MWHNRDTVPVTPPMASGGLVYYVSTGGELRAVDIVTGAALNSYDVETAGRRSTTLL